ncbi:uncharacterized protein LOC128217783 [Mya arenaria]|uniref:uncharacterized protein LOC128217783 n=1 Tax=Mya arenaria TaxID=6604 RepID=UPI0022E0AEA6|nr:uncharacterized protein LOC128217783 [Mya arenaria]
MIDYRTFEHLWESIKQNSEEEFVQCLEEIKIGFKKQKWCYDLINQTIPLCILYNRPSLIHLFFVTLQKTLKNFYFEDSMFHIASIWSKIHFDSLIHLSNVFRYTRCTEELQIIQQYLSNEPRKWRGYSTPRQNTALVSLSGSEELRCLFAALFEIGRNAEVETNVLLDHAVLLQQSYHVPPFRNHLQDYNLSCILKSIMLNVCRVSDFLSIAFKCGMDINVLDDNSAISFVMLYFGARDISGTDIYKRISISAQASAKLFKANLYLNPNVGLTHTAILFKEALMRDEWEFSRIIYSATFDEFIPDSFVYLLIRCGLNFPHQQLEAPSTYGNIIEKGFGVKTLQEHCRSTLRRHYRGRALHRAMNALAVPRSIRDFILIEEFNTLNI